MALASPETGQGHVTGRICSGRNGRCGGQPDAGEKSRLVLLLDAISRVRVMENPMKSWHCRSSLYRLPVTAATLFISAPASADEPPTKLPDLTVVTASRAEQAMTDTLASVSVITRDDIRLSVAEDLPELLRLQAGVDVVRAGPAGAQTSVFLRGGNSDHVLVLVDGLRVASPHTGALAWELLPLAAIERIEIVRGPRAVLYGSDAMSGVIQIFTRQPDTATARATTGSFGTFEAEAGVGVKSERGHHSIHAAYRRTDGFSAQNPGGFSYHPDDDGMEMSSGGASGEIGLASGSLQYRVLASSTETEFDQGESEAKQGLASLSWSDNVSEYWTYQLQAGYFDDRIDTDFGFFTSGFESRRIELGWQNQLVTRAGRLAFGLDIIDETGEAANTYEVNRDNRAGYLNWAEEFDHIHLELGGRLDDNSQFGSEFTWQAAAGIRSFGTGRLAVQLGTAFRAPDFGELYSPGFGGLFAGNPSLRPEQSRGMELNWRQDIGNTLRYSLAVFRNEVEDLIAFSGENFRAININQADLTGLEFELLARTTHWSIRANATLQRTRDGSTGQSLLRRPDRKAALILDRHFEDGGWLGLEVFASGQRRDVGGLELPGYAIASLRGGWQLNRAMVLQLRLENLLDKAYEPASGFNAAGRSAFLSIDWRG
jgi:vitamin B12 transporter